MRRAFKFRLSPNATQQAALATSLETHRRLWNAALAQRKDAWEQEKRSINYYEQRKHFAAVRNEQIAAEKRGEPGPHWLAHISSTSMRDTLVRLDRAFQAFFRRLKAGQKPGYPRFRGRDRYDSIPFDNYNSGCTLVGREGKVFGGMSPDAELRGHRLILFGIGTIKVRLHRPIRGRIKTVTVKREADHWFVVFSCDLGEVQVEPSTNPPVGIDVGLEHFATTSSGEHYPNPRPLKDALGELRRLNRKIALHEKQKRPARRQYPKRGSRGRQKTKKRLRRVHARVANIRKENHHKVALDLVRRYGIVAVESLNIKGMLGNGRLARAIGDVAWGGFLATLKTKAESAGVSFIEVNARGTSQECSGCGAVVRKDLDERRHDCPHCGLSLHRDHNAALNILERALRPARAEPAGSNGATATLGEAPGCTDRAPGKGVRPRKSLREASGPKGCGEGPQRGRSRKGS